MPAEVMMEWTRRFDPHRRRLLISETLTGPSRAFAVIYQLVLVEHGAADSFITPEQIAAFKAEMDQAGADYRFVELPGAKHGFSNPGAGSFTRPRLSFS